MFKIPKKTMKKIYLQPDIAVVTIRSQQLLTGSLTEVIDNLSEIDDGSSELGAREFFFDDNEAFLME